LIKSFQDQLRDHPEGIHVVCKNKNKLSALAVENNRKLTNYDVIKKEIKKNFNKTVLPFSKKFLKFIQIAKSKNFSRITETEFRTIRSILKKILSEFVEHKIIKQEDYEYLNHLINQESLKKNYTTGSAIVSLTLDLMNLLA